MPALKPTMGINMHLPGVGAGPSVLGTRRAPAREGSRSKAKLGNQPSGLVAAGQVHGDKAGPKPSQEASLPVRAEGQGL